MRSGDPWSRYAEAMLLPLINRTLEILMASVFVEYDPGAGGPEYFEFPTMALYQTFLQLIPATSKAQCKTIVAIPIGKDWHLAGWDHANRTMTYILKHAPRPTAASTINPTPPAPANTNTPIVQPKRFFNHATGDIEERAPDPPPRRAYRFTLRSPAGTMIEKDVYATHLVDLVRVEQQLRPDHLIISITYKGDA